MNYFFENLHALGAGEDLLKGPPTREQSAMLDKAAAAASAGVSTTDNAVAIGQTAAVIAPLFKDLLKGKKKKPKAPKFNPAMYQQPRSNTTKYLMYGIFAVALAGAGILAFKAYKKRKK